MKRLIVQLLIATLATLLTFAVVFVGCALRAQTFEQAMGFPFDWPIVALVFLGSWFSALVSRVFTGVERR